MRRSAWIALGAWVVAQTGLAQIHLDRNALVAIPPEDAVVLDPAELWGRTDPNQYTHIAGLEQPMGHARIVLRKGDKPSWWCHTFHIPFDPERYPIATVTYRATGILASPRPAFSLGTGDGESVDVALNQDLIADGELHELLVDLRELGARGAFNSLQITPHSRGPEPAVFELLGLRFESDHDLPPLAKRDEPEFSLKVVDAKGQGVPGATVTVDAERLNSSRTATTDAAGKVTLRAANNPRDEHTLRVAKRGRATVDLEPDKKGGFQPTVALLRGTPHGGTVRDEKGQPIANARVQIGVYVTHPQAGEQCWKTTPLTDQAGRWRTAPLPVEGVRLYVHLWHPDYLPESVRPAPAERMRQGTAVLVMRRGPALHGIVLSPDGEPVGGATVTQGQGRGFEGYASVKTGPDGRFAFTRRHLGKTVLTVEGAGFAPTVMVLDVVSGMAGLIVRLEPGHTIRGRVVDPVGEAIANVSVAIDQWRGLKTLSWHGRTDKDGCFSWHGAPSDAVQFRFRKKGYMSLETTPVTAAPAACAIVLPPLMRVSGTVTDAATGQPISDCKVMPGARNSAPSTSLRWNRRAMGQSRGGRYTISFDQVHSALGVRVEAPGYQPGISPAFVPAEGSRTFDFQLRQAPDIAGTVRLPDGRPAEGAEVYLVPQEESLQLPTQLGQRESVSCPSVETGANGSYRFSPMEGSWLLVARHGQGYVAATPALYAKSHDLHLEEWGRVEGTYRIGTKSAAGKAIQALAGPRRQVPGESRRFPAVFHCLSSSTDKQGHFAIDKVPPGEGMVGPCLRTGGNLQMTHGESYALRAGETIHVMIGGTGRPVAGRLALPKGADVEVAWQLSKAIVETAPKVNADRRTFGGGAQADGSFRVEDVPAGDYTLAIFLYGPAGPLGGVGQAIGSLEHRFAVPPVPGPRSDEPLDLGTLTVPLD